MASPGRTDSYVLGIAAEVRENIFHHYLQDCGLNLSEGAREAEFTSRTITIRQSHNTPWLMLSHKKHTRLRKNIPKWFMRRSHNRIAAQPVIDAATLPKNSVIPLLQTCHKIRDEVGSLIYAWYKFKTAEPDFFHYVCLQRLSSSGIRNLRSLTLSDFSIRQESSTHMSQWLEMICQKMPCLTELELSAEDSLLLREDFCDKQTRKSLAQRLINLKSAMLIFPAMVTQLHRRLKLATFTETHEVRWISNRGHIYIYAKVSLLPALPRSDSAKKPKRMRVHEEDVFLYELRQVPIHQEAVYNYGSVGKFYGDSDRTVFKNRVLNSQAVRQFFEDDISSINANYIPASLIFNEKTLDDYDCLFPADGPQICSSEEGALNTA